MKKKLKYLLTVFSLFFALSTTLNAATIKETTVEGDGFDTINNGDIVIGITRFEGNTIVTGSKVAKASTNDSVHYLKENGSLDNYSAPVIYVYAGVGGWFSLDDENKAYIVNDRTLISELENSDIYYVNNKEKKLEIDVKNLNIDENSLPKGVTKENDKLVVNATLGSFTVKNKDGIDIPFIINEGKYIENQSKYYTVDGNGFITGYNGPSGKLEILSKINNVNIVGIRSGAFDNKNITSVVIPESIMTIEANAFSNNALTSVIVNEKYDASDFTYLDSNAFGTFTDIKYNNDLTTLLAAFEDEITVNVQKDLDITKEVNQLGVANLILLMEEERLRLGDNFVTCMAIGCEEGSMREYRYINRYISILDGKTAQLTLRKTVNEQVKSVSKNISYEVNKVEASSYDLKTIDKATKEYETYYNNVKENFKNDTSLELTNTKKIHEIFEGYGIDCSNVEYGDGGENIENDIKIETSKFLYSIVAGDVLYEMRYIDSQEVVTYGFDVENNFSDEKEYINHALEEFKTITKVTDYEILGEDYIKAYMCGNKKCYTVRLKDNKNDNQWIIEIRSPYDISKDFEIDSSGFITKYSGIGGSIEIPSKINNIDVVGIRTGAFANEETSVIIPASVMTVEPNSFSSKTTNVIIKDKYDKTDFTSFSDNAFVFVNPSITYDNELTRALDLFENQIELNVQKDVDITKEESKYSLATFALIKELTRINDKNIGSSGYYLLQDGFNDEYDPSKITASMYYEDQKVDGYNTLKLELRKYVNNKLKMVSKTVLYSVNKVDGDSAYLEKVARAQKENKDNIDNIKNNFANDTSIKFSYVEELIRKYDLKMFDSGQGDSDDSDINLGNIKLYIYSHMGSLYSDDILYDTYEFKVPSASYHVEVNISDYNSDEEIYEYMLDEFKKDTKISNYEIINNGFLDDKTHYVDVYDRKIIHSINVKDLRNDNEWYISSTNDIPNDFIEEYNYGSSIETRYFPNLSYNDYDNLNDWVNAALEKYKQKSGATTIDYYNFELLDSPIEELNIVDGKYIYRYKISIPTESGKYWAIYLYRIEEEQIPTEIYESNLKTRPDVLNELINSKSLNNYFAGNAQHYFIKDEVNKKYSSGSPENYTHLGFKVCDGDNDKIYLVYYSDK